MTPLCIADRCRTRGHHLTGCANPECDGCVPRLAADGRRLCTPHIRSIEENAVKAADVYDALGDALIAAPAAGLATAVSGTPDRGLNLNPRAVAGRGSIIAVLEAWSVLIVEQRGYRRPASNPRAMGIFIAASSDWLAAYPAADDCVYELRELAYGEPWRVAHPTGARVIAVGQCPGTGDSCGGALRGVMRRPESLRASEIICDREDAHRWEPHQWFALHAMLAARGLLLSSAAMPSLLVD